MKSHEILKKATGAIGIKMIAAAMKLSSSLIYKWCQPVDAAKCGALNPLDRIADLYAITGDIGPIAWLCQRANGFFVRNPAPKRQHAFFLIGTTQKIVQEFADVLNVVSKSVADDGQINALEALKIRQSWEELKMVTEEFVVACESGAYQNVNASERAIRTEGFKSRRVHPGRDWSGKASDERRKNRI